MKRICCLDDLISLTNSESVELVNDIDCQGRHIAKIISLFKGTIDGKGHSISNLVIDDTAWGDEQKIALFCYLTHASIRNIRFENILFEINNGMYTPNIAGLCVEATDSVFENISMSVLTSDGKDIPMIHASIGGKNELLNYTCNNREYKIFKYKEGSLYEELI